MTKPIISIAMGDASGIGPELIVKLYSQKDMYEYCHPFVIGDPNVFREALTLVNTGMDIIEINDPSEACFSFSTMDVLRPEGVNFPEVRWGKVDATIGKASALCLRTGTEMALRKQIDGMISAPLSKEAFFRAGYGHFEEYMAKITNSPDPLLLGWMDPVWTTFVTSHIPFRAIASMITKERVFGHIQLTDKTLKKIGFLSPKIAVAALNVHGGEGGLFGREEIDQIQPGIEKAKQLDINVQGPFPADSIFVRAIEGEFDAVICMYHDQANIARKLHAKRRGTTLLIGLPLPFGTTAHGTAFDIAGKGIADPGSLKDTLRYTALLAS